MDGWQWWGLFVSAFISSTLFPGGSEVALIVLSLSHAEERIGLWAVATSGNSLGAMLTWWMGWWVGRRFGPDRLNSLHIQKAIARVRRFGAPVLFFSWIPVIGDPLCFAAGWLRIPLFLGLLMLVFGKGVRYAAVIAMS